MPLVVEPVEDALPREDEDEPDDLTLVFDAEDERLDDADDRTVAALPLLRLDEVPVDVPTVPAARFEPVVLLEELDTLLLLDLEEDDESSFRVGDTALSLLFEVFPTFPDDGRLLEELSSMTLLFPEVEDERDELLLEEASVLLDERLTDDLELPVVADLDTEDEWREFSERGWIVVELLDTSGRYTLTERLLTDERPERLELSNRRTVTSRPVALL